jgi:hypothetical protein
VPNYSLFEFTVEQLLDSPSDNDRLILEEDVRTLMPDGSLSLMHHEMSLVQARAIMRRIVDDDVIIKALHNSIQRAKLNPLGNMPVNGAHPVDPAVALIEERAVRPILGELASHTVISYFARKAYEHLGTIT